MANPPDDSTAAARGAARRFLAGVREAASQVGTPGWVGVAELTHRVADEAKQKARDWATSSGRRRFLIELASEARSEWMVQTDTEGPQARFYDSLRQQITKLAEAERG